MKNTCILSLLLSGILLNINGFSQEKRSLTPDDLSSWKRLKNDAISNDGKWISYEITPNVGDGVLHVKQPDAGIDKTFARGSKATFSSLSNYIVFHITPPLDTINKMRVNGVTKSKLPKDTLAIYLFEQDTVLKFTDVKSHQLAGKGSDWLALRYAKQKKEANNEENNKGKKDKKSKKSKKKKKHEMQPTDSETDKNRPTGDLILLNPISGVQKVITDVSEFTVSKYGNGIAIFVPTETVQIKPK